MLREPSAPSCEDPLWQPGAGGWARGVGGCSLGKKGPSSFTFYQKEQLFPVLGHRWYCAEWGVSERKKSKAELFKRCCSGSILLQLQLKKVDKLEFSGPHYAN